MHTKKGYRCARRGTSNDEVIIIEGGGRRERKRIVNFLASIENSKVKSFFLIMGEVIDLF